MARDRLSNRRQGETVTLTVPRHDGDDDGLRFHLTVNQYADGRLGEIFIESEKPNSDMDCTLGIIGILLSVIIQSGGDIMAVRNSLMSRGTGLTVAAVLAGLDFVTARLAAAEVMTSFHIKDNDPTPPTATDGQ